jgi:hypothetical protein
VIPIRSLLLPAPSTLIHINLAWLLSALSEAAIQSSFRRSLQGWQRTQRASRYLEDTSSVAQKFLGLRSIGVMHVNRLEKIDERGVKPRSV